VLCAHLLRHHADAGGPLAVFGQVAVWSSTWCSGG